MSADLLRRAATLLKHSAGAAQIGPWLADSWEIYSQTVGGPWVAETLHTEDEGQSIANGAYIALMHPPVALALAHWLEVVAVWGDAALRKHPSVDVARAILREPDQQEIDRRLSEGPDLTPGIQL